MERPDDPVPVDLRDYVEFDATSPAGRRVYATAGMAVDLVCLEPRQAVAARTFSGSDVVYTVLGGRAWVVTDEAEVTLEALQAVLVPAGMPHGVRNDSPDPLILHAVIGPPGDAPAVLQGPVSSRGQDVGASDHPRLLDRLRKTLGG